MLGCLPAGSTGCEVGDTLGHTPRHSLRQHKAHVKESLDYLLGLVDGGCETLGAEDGDCEGWTLGEEGTT